MSSFKRSVVWFRRDLRLSDHRALFEATATSLEVVPVFIIDETILSTVDKKNRQVGFIQGCIDELDEELRALGSQLKVLRGKPAQVLPDLVEALKADAVFFNHDYDPKAKIRDVEVAKLLQRKNVKVFSFKDQVIFERREIINGSNEPYRVFTPYSNNWLKQLELHKRELLKNYLPDLKKLISASQLSSALGSKLENKNPRFEDLGFRTEKLWITPGEAQARKSLRAFAKHIEKYGENRDFPAIDGTSSLGPHFRFGTVSIREAVRFCKEHWSPGTQIWLKELIWREFYQMILDQYPHVVGHAFRPEYDDLKWEGTSAQFQAWCEGRTGYPIVDAAMRQLNQTGWMHNRLRMVTAMFLTKDLLVDWRLGEKYFEEQLLDFDLASNNGGWQWSASTGCDAQPYFRVMNPVSQSERFDSDGDFIRKYVPELKKLDRKKIHWPHDEGLFSADLGGYPEPIVNHSTQRLKAIELFKGKK